MKVLLDENLPHELRHYLAEQQAFTVTFLGLTGMRNGELLAAAESRSFQVLVTMDAGMPFSQNLRSTSLSLVVLHAMSNAMVDLVPLVPMLLRALNTIRPGGVVHVGSNRPVGS